MELHIPHMTCGGCLRVVQRAIRSVDPDARVSADLARRMILIEGASDDSRVRQALTKAGFRPG